MIPNYVKSESTTPPDLVDGYSSEKVVYLRRNVTKKQRDNFDGEFQTYYEYEEAKLTKEEYERYLNELAMLDIRQQRADIDYIALCTGVDLEVQ